MPNSNTQKTRKITITVDELDEVLDALIPHARHLEELRDQAIYDTGNLEVGFSYADRAGRTEAVIRRLNRAFKRPYDQGKP